MESDWIARMVERELAFWDGSGNWHGMTSDNVRRFLVQPDQQRFSTHSGEVVPLWVVLDEAPGTSEGYLIVFDDTRGDFGLALKPQGSNPGVMIGIYGTLKDALQGM